MDEQTKQQAEALGKRLALLLAAVPLPDEAKEQMAAMIPAMTPEQLERFMELLEKELPDGSDLVIERAKEGMRSAQDALTKEHDRITQNTHRALDELEKELT